MLPAVLFAVRHWVLAESRAFLWMSAVAIIVFRSELCLFLGLLLLCDLVYERLTLKDLMKHGLPACLMCLGTSIVIDSFFWKRWLWPEGAVWYYNIILNKSSNWGTSPFLWYFYSALPRALLCAIPLSVVGIVVDKKMWILLVPAIGFVFLYSFLPHKELRFIIYVLPVFNVIAGRGLAYVRIVFSAGLRQRETKSLVCGALVGGLLAGSFLMSIGFLYTSHYNYPGGVAFDRLHQLAADQKDFPVRVHIDNYAAQTGVSRFGELFPWRYSKTDHLSIDQKSEFDYLIAEAGTEHLFNKTHQVVEEITGFSDLKFERVLNYLPPLPRLTFRPRLTILRLHSGKH